MPTITFSQAARREVEEVFTVNGRTFAWWTERDEDHGAPWDEEDGHGPVSEWTSRGKRPGEMVLCEDRRSKLFYDFAHAVMVAKEEGWDAPPYGEGTAGQRAHRAALADFNRLRDWCAHHWYYIGVCVQEVEDGEAVGEVASLWGIESDSGDYLRQVAEELAEEELCTEPPADLSPFAHDPDLQRCISEDAARMVEEEADSQREAEALALVRELAQQPDPKHNEFWEWIERAREIIGHE